MTFYTQPNLEMKKTLYDFAIFSIARNTFDGAHLLEASSNEKAEDKHWQDEA